MKMFLQCDMKGPFMRQVTVRTPGGLDHLQFADFPEPPAPRAGEVRVRIRASSLNFHDYLVTCGRIPTDDGRIPMSDGAGTVEAVGEGVTEFAPGDHVVSCFFPNWQDGERHPSDFRQVPGDGIDGYAREYVTLPFTRFTHAPNA